MLFKASRSSGSVILENVRSSSETLTLPSISLRMLRRSRDRALVLPVTSIRPLPVLVRIDRRFILGWCSLPSRKPCAARLSADYYRLSIAAAPGRLDHEAVPGIHLDLITALQLHDLAARAGHLLQPVLPGEPPAMP